MAKLLNLESALKSWSTWVWGALMALFSLAIAFPGFLYSALPQLMPFLPDNWQPKAALVLAVSGFIAKLLVQKEVMAMLGRVKTWIGEHVLPGSSGQ